MKKIIMASLAAALSATAAGAAARPAGLAGAHAKPPLSVPSNAANYNKTFEAAYSRYGFAPRTGKADLGKLVRRRRPTLGNGPQRKKTDDIRRLVK